MFVCVECGTESPYLCEQISPSILKLSQCPKCDNTIDKYIEYDGVLVLLNMLLLKSSVYRHIIYNRRGISNDVRSYTKYNYPASFEIATFATSNSVQSYYHRLTFLLFFSCITADTYITWLHAKKTDGRLDLHVLEFKFMVRLLQVALQSVLYYTSAVFLGVLFLGITEIQKLVLGLVVSSFAKLFSLPSAIWSQNTNLLVLSYLLVLINNFIVLKVMSRDRWTGPFIVVVICFCLERQLSFVFCSNVWPWDSLYKFLTVFNESNGVLTPVMTEGSPQGKLPVIETSPLTEGKKYVKLNIGGALFHTTIQTLVNSVHAQGTMLARMFCTSSNSRKVDVLCDDEGYVLIDRDGKHFGTILNYLRDGTFRIPTNKQDIQELLKEAQFYLLEDMAKQCQDVLDRESSENRDLVMDYIKFRIPVVTTPFPEKFFLSIKMPVVRFSYNRHNNKYSYTEKSDNTLLCNIELFDKLSSQHHNRLYFVRDLSGRNEICCWTFYGGGKKLSEISCTSIVYATERKQTKIEFPEAKILEETLNCTLYHNNEVELPDFSSLSAYDDSAPV